MKRIITLIMLAAVLLIGGVSAEAQTTKKKSSSSSSMKFDTFRDGCPSVAGHTYSGTVGGAKLSITFGPYYGDYGEVHMKGSYRGQVEEEIK